MRRKGQRWRDDRRRLAKNKWILVLYLVCIKLKEMTLNATDKKTIKSLTTLVADLLAAAQENPKIARKYNLARRKIEQAMKLIGGGQPQPAPRPESEGLPVHRLKDEPEPVRYEPEGDLMADNLGE